MSDTFDASGPLFLSYRQSDGTELVSSTAWLLRAAGIPVWRDQDDLLPGDTYDRLEQAIDDGLSGAVLVVTDEVAFSDVVRGIEAPRLIALHKAEPRFQLLIVNDVNRDGGGIDFGAPDRLLGRARNELASVFQVGSNNAELLKLVGKALWHRMGLQRSIVQESGEFALTVQTRNVGQVLDRSGAQLDLRIEPGSHDRFPSPRGLSDLRETLGLLPDAVTRTGASSVVVAGGAHLSVAFALGAALPSSRVGSVTVRDQGGSEWASTVEAVDDGGSLVTFETVEHDVEVSGRRTIAVYVDLLSSPSDSAFERYLDESGGTLVAHTIVRLATAQLIRPADAGSLASGVAAVIRRESTAHSNARVDLLLRCPFPIALLLGRLSNTLRARLYEWDDSDSSVQADSRGRPRYVPVLAVSASNPAGPITEVLLS